MHRDMLSLQNRLLFKQPFLPRELKKRVDVSRSQRVKSTIQRQFHQHENEGRFPQRDFSAVINDPRGRGLLAFAPPCRLISRTKWRRGGGRERGQCAIVAIAFRRKKT